MRGKMLGAALASGVLIAGCGGSSGTPTSSVGGASTAPSITAASTVASSAKTSRSAVPAADQSALAFARCVRANGVPNFPDPLPEHGLLFSTPGLDTGAPAVSNAMAKCKKLLPGGGPPGPGSTTHPSPQTLAKLVRIARCMRQHGISQFPDPATTVPSNPSGAGIREITDFDGAILLFPSSINMQAPAYRQALTACGAPPLGLPH
jgi:hypothetical protein